MNTASTVTEQQQNSCITMSTELTSVKEEENDNTKELDKIKQMQNNRERRNAIDILPEEIASVFAKVTNNATQDKKLRI